MKRSALKRKPIKRKSAKQSKLERTHCQERRAFLEQYPVCWFCGARSESVHEIASGNGIRNLAFGMRLTWAATCNDCNCHEMTNKTKWPLARQLAVKLINDRNHFDLLAFNQIRGRAPTAITLGDVAQYLYWF